MLLDNNLQDGTDLAAVHALGPNQVRCLAGTTEIDLGLTITKDMHMGRMMIIGKDDDTRTPWA